MSERRRIFFVTGANGGVGLEATRQLLQDDSNCHVYMLCRSKERAEKALETLDHQGRAFFLAFDATQDFCQDIPDTIDSIDGLLLNAGGFGDDPKLTPTTRQDGNTVCPVAQLNLLGHAALVKKLLALGKLTSTSRIVASGTEGCFAPPSPNFQWETCDFSKHLAGEIAVQGSPYGWVKGILAFYWAAFARHHPDIFVLTVSPGAVKGTGLLNHGGVTSVLRMFAHALIFFKGSNTIQVGAKHYVDALLARGDFSADKGVASGSFFAHRKGYNQDFGDVTQHKAGKAFADQAIQDRAWEAVEAML
ncbi:short chain dehydrogenase [Seminavis robusta]|uniref:Short chain dehydrogenase n=1 Tax=Seminavis robusta TaxID=568900 RepID=A0A9N8HNQ4_9STRA|nr:short chain dehydrogenase [Seminavis robusta]|eukprot:Sro1241_g255410.1 short chain dehydrogenase (305) ;mRNA; f:8803-9717